MPPEFDRKWGTECLRKTIYSIYCNIQVETVGTVYMVVSGAPKKNRAHAQATASAALAVSQALPMLTIGKLLLTLFF